METLILLTALLIVVRFKEKRQHEPYEALHYCCMGMVTAFGIFNRPSFLLFAVSTFGAGALYM